MSNKFFNVSLLKSPHLFLDGDSQTLAFPMYDFESKYTNADAANPGDNYYIQCDPQRITNFYRYIPYELTRPTTVNDNTEEIQFTFGTWGSFHNQFMSQDSWSFIGSRDNPHTREGFDGTVLFKVSQPLYVFIGLRAESYDTVFEVQNDIDGLTIHDTYVENVNAVLYPITPSNSATLSNVEIDGMHGVNVAVSLAHFGANSTNITIRNFSVYNNTCEDGEFRGFNFFDNCSKILIEDGEFRGAIDTWVKFNTVDRGAWVASTAYVENDRWLHPVSGLYYQVFADYTSDAVDPDVDILTPSVRIYPGENQPKHGTGIFTQGEGISMEESNANTDSDPYFKGFIAIIRRVHSYDNTDRGFDIKPKALMEDCSVSNSKRGITLWATGSIARRCFVKSPRRSGSNQGIGFLLIGSSTLENCGVTLVSANNECAVSITTASGGQDITTTVIGGEYTTPAGVPVFKTSGGFNVTLILTNVTINGSLYNETVSLVSGDTYL